MGGKNRQAQRTKNNAKPSNSGRSAEFLSNNVSQFSGFTGMKETGFIFSKMTCEEIELGIDANFQLVLKKMNKKDNTTKIKALQEFADLVKNSDAEVVKTVLPCWPRLYNTLSTDSEHKVREATHLAHNEVVKKVKRNLAPYLKSIIAAWFTSQYDTYAPAATAATLSFKNAFPEKKVEEVLVFCNKEILDYIYDNLFNQTTQTVANPKHNTAEELVAKLERVLISSLLGYSLYLKKTPKDKIEESAEMNRKIIGNNKFWKYSKHNLRVIRGAWFEVLSSLLERTPFLLEKEEGHVVSYTLGNIDEKDPIVLPLVWQNVLLTVTCIKDWNTKVNVEKLMLPKLWKILKDGGQGNASVIFPNLLPLLSNIMDIVDPNTFYDNFFQNVVNGLKQKTVLMSRSESTAVSTALVECMRYVIMKNESNSVFCEKIIESFLIPTIHWCLVEEQTCYKVIFNQTASLVQYWSKNCSRENSNYTRYMMYFWDHINSMFEEAILDVVSSNPVRLPTVTEKQVEFFKTMKHLAKTKKSLKVKFDPEYEPVESMLVNSSVEQLSEQYMDCLTTAVLKTCYIYIGLINDKRLKELFEHVATLMDDFDSKIFFDRFTQKIGNDGECGNFVILDKLKDWLCCESFHCKALIHIVFITFKYVENDGKQTILGLLSEVSSEESFGWCLEEALSYRYNREPLIRQYLRTEKVANFLVDIVKKEISNCCPSSLSALFKLAVTGNDDEELYVSEKAISGVMSILSETLSKANDHLDSIDKCARLAADLSLLVYTKDYLLKFTDQLLLSMMQLSCNACIDTEYLSSDTMWEVQTAWQDAMTLISGSLPKDEFDVVINKVVSFIHESLKRESLDEKVLERTVDVLISLCRAVYKSTPLEMGYLLSKLFDNDFILEERERLIDICKWTEYLKGELTSCYEEFEVRNDVRADCLNELQFFSWIYVKVKVIFANIQEEVDDESWEEGGSEVELWSILDMRIQWIAQTLYDLLLGQCFGEHYETVKLSARINELVERSYSYCVSHLKKSLNEDRNSLWLFLREKALSHSWIWTKIIRAVQNQVLNMDAMKSYEELVRDATVDEKLSVIHATQVFSRFLDYDTVAGTYDDVGRIITLRCLSGCTEIDVQIAEVMSILDALRGDASTCTWESFELDWIPYQVVLETCRLFNELIRTQFDHLSGKQIDLIIISVTEWLQRLAKSNNIKTAKVEPMLMATTDLYKSICVKISKLRATGERSLLVKEWDDLFAETAQNDLLELWINLYDYFKETQQLPLREWPVMCGFTLLADLFDHNLIFKETEEAIKKRSKLVKQSCELLTNTNNTLQLAGYKMLMRLIPGLVEIDTRAVDTNTPNKDGLIFELFKGICASTQEIVSTMLIDLKLGEDSCRIEPFTHSYNFTLAYLFTWDVMLCLCEKASTELKFQYADWLKREDVLKRLLDNLFRLMPLELFQFADPRKLYRAEWFSARPRFDPEKICTSATLEHMVCWVYFSALSQLPALVRHWWTGVDTRIAQIVERITSIYVSPLLCSRELKEVMQHEKTFKNMTVKVLPVVREVVAIYTVDEAQMELVITLPANHPLHGPDVTCNRQIGGTSQKQWLMQFKKCVLHQNGRIWDGLSLWNNNLDKKFDGVEECYICFAVLHPGTYQIPKLSCQTCRKKFHSACLYKWFSTSNKSSCPICRNLF